MVVLFGFLAIACIIINGWMHETPPHQDARRKRD